jgi:hypothetical protein
MKTIINKYLNEKEIKKRRINRIKTIIIEEYMIFHRYLPERNRNEIETDAEDFADDLITRLKYNLEETND